MLSAWYDLWRTACDKVLRDKAVTNAKDPKCDGYQRSLAAMVYNFFDKKSAMHAKNKIKQNHQLAEELNKPVIKKFEKRTVYSGFKDNI